MTSVMSVAFSFFAYGLISDGILLNALCAMLLKPIFVVKQVIFGSWKPPSIIPLSQHLHTNVEEE